MRTLSAFLALLLAGGVASAQQRPRTTRVKDIVESVSSRSYEGVVEKIDADELVLVEKRDKNVTVTHKFAPIDVLRAGGVIHNSRSGCAYRWEDVKTGDTVRLESLKDDGDGQTYCLQISIRRRPGSKLPESQNSKDDRGYDAHRVLNDIENGEDVSEEELLKVWPPEVDRKTGETTPGGLYTGKYKDMLDANRKRIAEEKAKKEKELKAKPATDKSEVKKGDKK
jgi:hypothetical protein